MTLRLLTFDGSRSHPGHIQCVIHSHLTVFHLGCIVRETTGVATRLVVVYADRSLSGAGPNSPLPEDQSLEELGYMGGPQNSPVPVTLYYDFAVDFTSCPVLMCDHYFGQKRTMDAAVREVRQRQRSLHRQKQQPSQPAEAAAADVSAMSED